MKKRAPIDGHEVFSEAFSLVLSARERRPAAGAPRRLNALFRELQDKKPRRAPDDIEDLIWAIWIGHENAGAASSMHAAIEAMRAGEADLARPILDRLIDAFPEWPEAWNKRAILAVMAEQDEAGLADIVQTLRLEPRHFGAISGFAQLCLRGHRYREARAAFQIALMINPHLEGVMEAIAELSEVGEMLH